MKKRLKADERKAIILEAAKDLFSKKGFYGVSVDEIAEKSNVSASVIYKHFKSKEVLYETTLNNAACRRDDYIQAVLSGPTDFQSVLYRMTLIYLEGVVVSPEAFRMELHSALDNNEVVKRFYSNHWKNFSDYIENTLENHINQKDIPPLDTKAAALFFQGMLRELVYQKCVVDMGFYKELDTKYMVSELVKRFLIMVGLTQE